MSLHGFYVPASDHGVASGFNCHPHFEHCRGKLSMGICVNSAVDSTFNKGMHVITSRKEDGNCNGCIIVHRPGKLRAVCKRLSGRLIGRGRVIGTKRPVKLKKGAKHSANSRLRFRAHFLKMTVGPTGVFSFRTRSIMKRRCMFQNGKDGGAHITDDSSEPGRTSNSKTGMRQMGSKRGLSVVTSGHKAAIRGLYQLGKLSHGSILEPKRVLECSWRVLLWVGRFILW